MIPPRPVPNPGLRARLLGFLFSPRGIVVLAALYLLVGLLGHDPWRGDDSRYFGPILGMLRDGSWLVPRIAGEPYLEFPPLYYWLGAGLAGLTSPLLPLHDGGRLASALCVGASLFFLARAASELHGRPTLSTVCLLTLGSLGLVIHAHETQPMLAILATTSLTYGALAILPRRPQAGGLLGGLGSGLSTLAGGLSALGLTLPLILAALLAPPLAEGRGETRRSLTLGILLGALVVAAWALPLYLTQPDLATAWWRQEADTLLPSARHLEDLAFLVEQLGWFLWPLWPIAGWALWRARRQLTSYTWRTLVLALALALAEVALLADSLRPANLLPLIPPTALLACAGVHSLRRGAASAFDWFALMTFLVFAILVGVAWSAMAFAWPPGLARQLVKLAPGFQLEPTWGLAAAGAFLVLGWLALVWNAPRSPNRGPINWATGMTMLWALAVCLLMPWFDYGKSYRPAAQSLARALGGQPDGCIAGQEISASVRASLDYFAGIRVRSLGEAGTPCRLLLVAADRRTPLPEGFHTASLMWEYRRGGGRQLEVLRLYRRG
jgi:4-amino-4-deoxy-L-arabinose transferase-like glycosyltransferase